MRVIQQTSIGKSVTLEGVGLHSGASVSVTLRPAAAGQGVIFRRLGPEFDGSRRNIEATPAAVRDTRLATRLKNEFGASVATVEHLMAAIALAGVDNVFVDVSGDETPALDGSAAPFLEAIERAGRKSVGGAREAIRIMAPIDLREGDQFIRADPFDRRILEVEIKFPDAAIGAQKATLDLDNAHDVRRVAAARTFCRAGEIEAMRAAGLSLGGSLENAVVVDGAAVLNPEGLRDPQEFALHKALDLIGDLRLAGAPILGRITARRPGHGFNLRFVERLLASRASIERVIIPADPAGVPA
jgi:UDP-3-O-[3-hydroxymyristoyl] N-acetylglucosamine deacetylase